MKLNEYMGKYWFTSIEDTQVKNVWNNKMFQTIIVQKLLYFLVNKKTNCTLIQYV